MLDDLFRRLEDVGLFVAAHKYTFPPREVEKYAEVYFDGTASHYPVRIQALSNVRRPRTTNEVMLFLQGVNSLQILMPRMSGIVTPLRMCLDKLVSEALLRTKRVPPNGVIPEDAWTDDRVQVWHAAQTWWRKR